MLKTSLAPTVTLVLKPPVSPNVCLTADLVVEPLKIEVIAFYKQFLCFGWSEKCCGRGRWKVRCGLHIFFCPGRVGRGWLSARARACLVCSVWNCLFLSISAGAHCVRDALPHASSEPCAPSTCVSHAPAPRVRW